MCFKEEDLISSLNGKPPKSDVQFVYLGIYMPSTENGLNIRIG